MTDAMLIINGNSEEQAQNFGEIMTGLAAILNADATSEAKMKALETAAQVGSVAITNCTFNGGPETHTHHHAGDSDDDETRESPWSVTDKDVDGQL